MWFLLHATWIVLHEIMEPIKSNLEPIEESDLDLRGKLEGRTESYGSHEQSPFQVEKETVQEVSGVEKDATYNSILSKVQNPQQQTVSIDPVAVAMDAETAAKVDAESRVQHLVDVAQQKGVVHAVKVAQHLRDNYVLDTMHDKLADEFHDALAAKGMIKEI